MKLWLLRPIDEDSEDSAWNPWFDKAFGFVVRAETELAARLVASARHGDEGGAAWLLREQSTCDELMPSGVEEVVMIDYRSA